MPPSLSSSGWVTIGSRLRPTAGRLCAPLCALFSVAVPVACPAASFAFFVVPVCLTRVRWAGSATPHCAGIRDMVTDELVARGSRSARAALMPPCPNLAVAIVPSV
ncbi:hypothetical protein BJ085DRAFT_35351 [Dimargaris cristalligena]|uniref:Uncharacterized protein n=1 Tax=Dimargaris cristalligena TaxID=215637 RepID=A0A4P9ZIU4_9FUNG|nr:hypothetical protein BJ085DRAFT_35351 [Dimargaris cristalligena]|eukprot:RKP33107.1 hypothetical protein BJ085DRAFT_35351 [Dimargaris cristalligena]